jgi:hypothetical protein
LSISSLRVVAAVDFLVAAAVLVGLELAPDCLSRLARITP